MVFAVFFPFIAAICLWFLRRNKSSQKDPKMWANVMIAACAVELVTAFFLPVYHLYMDKPLAFIEDISIYDYFFHSGFYTHNRVNFWSIGGLSLTFAYEDSRAVFSIITAFAWFAASLFSKEYMKNDTNAARFNCFSLLTLGAVMGVFLAGDLFTLFIFFEIMSFTSFMWVAHRQTKGALYASGTYLGISAAGGMAILMGLFIVYSKLGTLDLDKVGQYAREFVYYYDGDRSGITLLYVAAGCMFAGFGAKAGAFPVHAWLPEAYVEAPDPATALLSAVLSKTGIWGILIITASMFARDINWGIFVLIIGVITMVYGGLRGVLSDNLKTTLAYSSMSQLGFILVGAGMWGILALSYSYTDFGSEGWSMAIDGTILHMINHSIVKLVLFLAAGIVFMNVGSYELNRVRGFGRQKPFLLVTFLLAAAGVGGIPLLNGYCSKTLLHESIVEGYEFMAQYMIPLSNYALLMRVVEYLFLFSGGLTIAYMTKLFVVIFVEKNEDSALQSEYESKKNYASVLTKLSVLLCVLPIPVIGISAFFAEWNMFSLSNLSGSFISIAVGVIVYFLVVRLIVFNKNENSCRDIFPKWLDIEKYVYRAIFYKAIPFVLGIISRILDSIVDTLVVVLKKTVYSERALPYELPEGNRITHRIGVSMENIRHLYYTLSKKNYEPKDYEHKLALKNTDFFESLRIIERSLSFGLFMFCIGLVLTMIYLLVVNQ